jgi:hypothetical protein
MPQVTCDGRPTGKGFVAGMALTVGGDAPVLIGGPCSLALFASLGRAADRPLHPELVGEVAVVIVPELLLECDRDPSARGQRVEHFFGRTGVVGLDVDGASLHRL